MHADRPHHGPHKSPRWNGWLTFLLLITAAAGFIIQTAKRTTALDEAAAWQLKAERLRQRVLVLESANKQYELSVFVDVLQAEIETKDTLSKASVDKIVRLCAAQVPYFRDVTDSLAEHALSPERGQMLFALLRMEIDSLTWSRILNEADFSGADLRNMALQGADLRGVRLDRADLSGADLSGANLRGAHLLEAKLRRTVLDQADLSGADIKRANARWSSAHHANFYSADLNGASIRAAILDHADLNGADLRWVDADEASLAYTCLVGADLEGVKLKRTNLTQSDMRRVQFFQNALESTILTDARLDSAQIEKQWLERLDAWQTVGRESIGQSYRAETDSNGVIRLLRVKN
jgi:uncharacterized protein YjbI with pentapeptide repeats